MIVATGLTPAWQQILRFESFHVGEVNRAAEAVWCASGKVLNVGLALAHLGAECLTVAPLGGLPTSAIEREFAALGARAQWLQAAAATRVCTTILDSASGRTTELVENAAPLTPAELQAFVEAYTVAASTADTVVLTGSLPAGTPPTIYRKLLSKTKGRAVIDARGPELLAALEARPFLVKPNREELARTVSRPLACDDDVLAAMRELNARGATWVVVTQGKEAVWVTSALVTERLESLRVEEIVNPIGCGDCLAAGIAWGLERGHEPLEAIRLGIAAAAENVRQLLPARLDPRRVEELAAAVR